MSLSPAQKRSLSLLRWMIAACIALPLLLFAHQGTATYNATWTNADLEVARTRDIAREHAVKVLETIERSLSEIGEVVRGRSDEEIRANEKAFHDRLAVIDQALPQMKSAWIIDAEGRVLANSISLPAPTEPFADRDYFAVHRDRDIGTYVGRVLIPKPPFGGIPFFSMSRRRAAIDDRFAGVIQASILPDYFQKFYKEIGFEDGAFIVLALADGAILASQPALPLDAQISPEGTLGTQLASSPDIGLATIRLRIDGVERRIAYQKLGSYPVYVAAGLSTDAIFRRWMREFSSFLFIAVPGTLLLLLMLWLFLQATKRLYVESANRERAEVALRENQRLEALGQLTGGVAHDFNNFLTVIGASADLLRRDTLTDERRLRYIDAITETVGRATNLTGQLLAFARRQPLRSEIFDACQRIETMAGVLQTLLGVTIDIRLRREPHECFVEADASQFETALINLAANARDAMPNGGELTLAVTSTDALPPRLGGLHRPDGYVAISVADTGEGVPADQIDRIFEPFFTTKDIGRGTGLGLPQVFGFAKQSRGEVMVDSVVGQGATFTLFLPRVVGQVVSQPSRDTPAAMPQGDGLCVLLVDDNEALLQATGDALRARGFAVVTSATADAALTRLNSGRETVDVVLTDVVMPGTSGLELARELQCLYPQLPVIITTGYSQTVEKNGSDTFMLVRKPYNLDELASKLIKATQAHESVFQ